MSDLIPPNATPVERLLHELAGPWARRSMAQDVARKSYEPWHELRLKAARLQVLIEEMKIEDIVRTWVENQPPRKVTDGGEEDL